MTDKSTHMLDRLCAFDCRFRRREEPDSQHSCERLKKVDLVGRCFDQYQSLMTGQSLRQTSLQVAIVLTLLLSCCESEQDQTADAQPKL